MGHSKPQKKREITVHSRAARRAVSPSINLDKAILAAADDKTGLKPAAKPHAVLSSPAGVRKQKAKPLKRQQRLRQMKGMERASDVLDKHEIKVQKSLVKVKSVSERAKAWDDINEEKRKRKLKNPYELLEEARQFDQEREWVSDEDMDAEAPDAAAAAAAAESVELPVAPVAPVAPVEEDEML